MDKSNLKPFLREGLDILFVGLNPAAGSSAHGHYFSVNPVFWNQLYDSRLITRPVDMMEADTCIFGSCEINRNGWSYGITDLVTEWAESDSSRVRPTDRDCRRLISEIQRCQPRTVVILHSKVRKCLARYLGKELPDDGYVGRWFGHSVPCDVFCIPFPHGNAITSNYKVTLYKELRNHLDSGRSECTGI